MFVDSPTASSYNPQNGDVVYLNSALTVPYDGQGQTYRLRISNPPFSIIRDAQFDIDSNGVISNLTECSNTGGGVDPITTESQTSSSCFSCWTIEVDVPQNETRNVQIISNFQTQGSYAPGFCNSTGAVQVASDVNENITSSKKYVFGIDADNVGGANPSTSSITVIVRNGAGAVIDQKNFNRTHNDQKC